MHNRGNPDLKDEKDYNKDTTDDQAEVQKWTQPRVTQEY